MNTYPKEIGKYTAELWLNSGTISIEEHGEENTYYRDQFGKRFFCKNYPNRTKDTAAVLLSTLGS